MSALDVDLGEFRPLELDVGGQLPALAAEIGLLGVGLRADRDILARRHRHRTCHQPGNAGEQDLVAAGSTRRDADDQACGRDDAVVGAEDRCPQPTDPLDQMALEMRPRTHGDPPVCGTFAD